LPSEPSAGTPEAQGPLSGASGDGPDGEAVGPTPSASTPSAPSSPPAPSPSAPSSPTWLDAASDALEPGSSGLPARSRLKPLFLKLCFGAVGILLAAFAGVWASNQSAESTVRDNQRAEDQVDREERPFVGTVEKDRTTPENWKIVLDRTLTEKEAAKLRSFSPYSATGMTEAARFLTSLGGRVLRFPPLLDRYPPGYTYINGGDAAAFNLNLFSKRQAQLSITDMRPVGITCHRPTAKTVAVFPPQGGAAYEGIFYDLTRPESPPIVTDPDSRQGRPYFARRKIDLGGGESPGGLHVESVTKGRTCDWRIRAEYSDADSGSGHLTLQNGRKPFRTEAAPTRPEQLFYVDPSQPRDESWVACHEQPSELACRQWVEERSRPAPAPESPAP
jgi:hypothetical protein